MAALPTVWRVSRTRLGAPELVAGRYAVSVDRAEMIRNEVHARQAGILHTDAAVGTDRSNRDVRIDSTDRIVHTGRRRRSGHIGRHQQRMTLTPRQHRSQVHHRSITRRTSNSQTTPTTRTNRRIRLAGVENTLGCARARGRSIRVSVDRAEMIRNEVHARQAGILDTDVAVGTDRSNRDVRIDSTDRIVHTGRRRRSGHIGRHQQRMTLTPAPTPESGSPSQHHPANQQQPNNADHPDQSENPSGGCREHAWVRPSSWQVDTRQRRSCRDDPQRGARSSGGHSRHRRGRRHRSEQSRRSDRQYRSNSSHWTPSAQRTHRTTPTAHDLDPPPTPESGSPSQHHPANQQQPNNADHPDQSENRQTQSRAPQGTRLVLDQTDSGYESTHVSFLADSRP